MRPTTGDTQAHDDDDFKIKGADSRRRTRDSSDSCTICLQPVTDRAVAVPCDHLSFDFLCLVTWLQERPACPLCNATVVEVQYEFCSTEDGAEWKTYQVPRSHPKTNSQSPPQRSRERARPHHPSRRSLDRTNHDLRPPTVDPAVERRRKVYRDRLYSLHVGSNPLSRYRDRISCEFAALPETQARARVFLRRELQAFGFLDTPFAPRAGNRDFLSEYIVAILRTADLKGADGRAEDMLADYLGRFNTRLLFHELDSWLRSPYLRLESWDRNVQYLERNEDADKEQCN